MKRSQIILLVLSLFLGLTQTYAQKGKLNLDVKYSAGFAIGDFKSLMKDHSYRGWQASLLYGINDKISVGLGTGLQDFYYKEDRRIYNSGEEQISAVLSHSIQTVPILATVRYNLKNTGIIQPYAGLGLGGNMIMYSRYLGEFGDNQNSFGFAARPELGVFIPFKKNGEYGFNIGANYNYMPYKKNGIESLSHAAVFGGIKIPLRGDR